MIDKVFEIPESLDELEKEIVKTPMPIKEVKEKPIKEKPAKKKNNVSEEGRLKMLANLKKGRETRKFNLNKANDERQQGFKNELKSDIDSLKQLVKDAFSPRGKPAEEKPIVSDLTPATKPIVSDIVQPKPVVSDLPKPKPVLSNIVQPVQAVVAPYIVRTLFNKPKWG